jgi:hypothetical protein
MHHSPISIVCTTKSIKEFGILKSEIVNSIFENYKPHNMERRTFIKKAGLAGSMIAVSPLVLNCQTSSGEDFPLMDLHVHLTENFTIEHLMKISEQTQVQFGVVENPGARVNSDESLNKFIDSLRPYPVWIGLQPMSPGWTSFFSKEAISRLDYILMDPQTVPHGNKYNETLYIWNYDTYVDDTEAFMKSYMDRTMKVLDNDEPLTTLGWPLFLPVCIARDYYEIWTEERMQQIITAAKARKINIEINDLAHTPHEKFIIMAKEQGLKFTFGSDTRDKKAGRLDYCKQIAIKCGLTRDDFYVPERKLVKAT